MASFLSRLAGRTLGLVAIAEPIIPARLTPPAPDDARPRMISVDTAEWGKREPARIGLRDATQEAQARLPIRVRRDTVADTDAVLLEQARSTKQHDAMLAHSKAFRNQPSFHPTEEEADRSTPDFERPPIEALPPVAFRETEPRPERAEHVVPIPLATARTFESRARVLAPEVARDEAPWIQVSIGRIEIRTEAAAVPTPAPRRGRPATLSLSDYLRQQDEARR